MKPIFLIGYMGSGKSTLGRVLADNLGCQFTDLDTFIESRFHKTISQLFAQRGEQGFRELEHKMLNEIAEFQDIVIACGGGTPCFNNNMATMKEKGIVVYLSVPVERLYARLSRPRSKAKRPVIAAKTNDELMQFIADNLQSRQKFYTQANIIFDTSKIETAAQTQITASRLLSQIQQYFNSYNTPKK